MRLILLLVVLTAINATATASPSRVSGAGFTLVALDGWENKTAGDEIALKKRTDPNQQLRASLTADLAKRAATSVRSDAECKLLSADVATYLGVASAVGVKAKAAKRATCELTGKLGPTSALVIMFPINKTAAVFICTGPNADPTWQAECRTMAGSTKIDPKAKPDSAAMPAVTTTKLPSGGTQIRVAKLRLELAAGWQPRATTADQIFAALKGNAILSFTRIPRVFKGNTDANCSKLAADAAKSQSAKGEGRMTKLSVGNACVINLESATQTLFVAYINGPGPAEHVLFSCGSTDKEPKVFQECGYALGTLAFDTDQK